jgi:hypothetical protein
MPWVTVVARPGGGRHRNARLAWLRVLVPVTNVITGIGLVGHKQLAVVTDHDKVLARNTFRCRSTGSAAKAILLSLVT